MKVTNIGSVDSVTLTTDTVLEFGNGQFSTNLSEQVVIGPEDEVELVFDEEEIPELTAGEYEVTIEFHGTESYYQEHVVSERIYIPPATLTIDASNSPVIVRGDCDFATMQISSNGEMRMVGSKVSLDVAVVDGKVSGHVFMGGNDLHVGATGKIIADESGKVTLEFAENMYIAGEIRADKCGFGTDKGPGCGKMGVGVGGGGAGFGGEGEPGTGNPDSGGRKYFYVEGHKGSGGGCAQDIVPVLGGRGGGAIRIKCGGSVSIEGLVSANGENGSALTCGVVGSGGGSGGSVYIEANELLEDGDIEAKGGNGGTAQKSGGGNIRIVVLDTLTVNGTISANGGPGVICPCSASGEVYGTGGGAGGGIWIYTENFAGGSTGKITANGGPGGGIGEDAEAVDKPGGGGGGGRILVVCETPTYEGKLKAAKGQANTAKSAQLGEDGTVYVIYEQGTFSGSIEDAEGTAFTANLDLQVFPYNMTTAPGDPNEDNPGVVIVLNGDADGTAYKMFFGYTVDDGFDEQIPGPDYNRSYNAAEDDLLKAVVNTTVPVPLLEDIKVEVTSATDKIKFWKDSKKGSSNHISHPTTADKVTPEFWIEAVKKGTSMREVTIKTSFEIPAITGEDVGAVVLSDTVRLTILWVEIDTVGIRTTGTASGDNAGWTDYATSPILGRTDGTSNLGEGGYNDNRHGWGVEIVGTVHPSEFAEDIVLERYTFGRWFNNSNVQVAGFTYDEPNIEAEHNDISPATVRDDKPQSGASEGVIFDLDAPGIATMNPQANEIRRIRMNSCQIAQWTPPGGVSRQVSAFFYWKIAHSYQWSGTAWSQVGGVTGDNTVGKGLLQYITWNLQQ